MKTSLYDARGKVDALIGQVQELIAEQSWDGVIISGAPKKRSIPACGTGSAELKVPVSLALRSSVTALKAFAAKRILLMTPVDDDLKKLYCDYLDGFGIASFYPPQILRVHTDALKLSADDVEEMTHRALADIPTSTQSIFRARCSIPYPS